MDWEQAGIMKQMTIDRAKILWPIFSGILHGGQGTALHCIAVPLRFDTVAGTVQPYMVEAGIV